MQVPTIATGHTIVSSVGETDHARRTHSERHRAAQAQQPVMPVIGYPGTECYEK